MSQSNRVRFSDLRRAYRLIHDCRDVGHDPAAWAAVLVEGLARLVGAQLAAIVRVTLPTAGGSLAAASMADHGWRSAGDRSFWLAGVHSCEWANLFTFRRAAAIPGRLVSRSREQLAGDAEWYASAEFNEVNRRVGVDDFIGNLIRVGREPEVICVLTQRPFGGSRFALRERRLSRLFLAELTRHYGLSLATGTTRPFAALPPRLKQVLDGLLNGDSEKQVAFRLGLSRHTVHDYIHELYRRVGVHSRAELFAVCRANRTT